MIATQSVDNSSEVRKQLVLQVFSNLCRWALADASDSSTAERRLWRLPEVATYFVFKVVTDDDRREVDSIVHRLRVEVGKLINSRLDRSAAKKVIAERVALALDEFVLRPWRPDDAPRLAALLDSQRLWEGLPDEKPGPVTEDLASNLITISNGWAERHFVNAIEWRQQPIGQVRLQFDSSPFPDAAEISYWFGESYWGQGLATRLVTLFTAVSFKSRRHLQRIFAQVLDGNVASIRVLEKAGYRYESFRYQNATKRGSKHSTHVFGVCRDDYDLAPHGD